ncbi:hypothetical protein DYB34_008711 [Aphanomyces astaci]|uniref:RING-type domain-containing protein n=2 Tax=Aphanomyces astaci TaxID=112090 RepID=A0A3R6VM08_APHAT|nr:hypothetical protein DYB34_008711 [Aphanomyces astaci]
MASTATRLGSQLIQVCSTGIIEDARTVLAAIKKEKRPTTALEYRHPTSHFTPLHTAAFHGHAEIADLLLQYGADIHTPTNVQKKNTPLHVAAYYGHAKVLKVLVARGADLYRLNADGLLPLDLVRFKNHTEPLNHQDAARVLLFAVEVHKGSAMYLSSAGLHPWKACFAHLVRVQSGAPGQTMVELALHAERNSLCPFKVVLFDSKTTRFAMSSAPGQPCELTLSTPVCCYNFKAPAFSRDPSIRRTTGTVVPSTFVMRVHSADEASRWIDVCSMLQGIKSSPMGPDTFRQLSPPSRSAARNSYSSSLPISTIAPPPPPFRGPPPSYDEVLAMQSQPTSQRGMPPPSPPPFPPPPSPITYVGSRGPVDDDCAGTHTCRKNDTLASSMAKLAVTTTLASAPELTSSANECVICMDEVRNAVCIPCGHLSSCFDCLSSASTCPICRTPIQSVVKIYTA